MAAGRGGTLYALGGLEIVLILIAVVLLFGVGKLSHVGGALGKSIREFKAEKNAPLQGDSRHEPDPGKPHSFQDRR